MSGYEFEKLPLSAFGDLRVVEISPIFHSSFEYTVDNTEITTNSVVAGGTVTQADGMAVIGTSTTTGSTAILQSKTHARYHAGFGGLMRVSALFTAGVSGTVQYAGLADTAGSSATVKNGYMVGYDGTTFGFHRFQNDTKISVAQTSWDDPMDGTGESGMLLDSSRLNVFFIQFQYLGAGAIKLWVEREQGDLVLAHSIQYANSYTSPSVHNPNFYAMFIAKNGATTSNVVIKTGSYGYFVEGKTSHIEYHQPQFATGLREKTTVTTETAIFTIRCRSTYASKTNFIDIQLERLVASIEATSANNLGSVRLVKNATLGGSPSYADINTNNSVVEIDTAGTTVTGGTTLLAIPLAGKNDKSIENVTDYKFILQAGESITVAGTSANSATIVAAIMWKELF
jgi:hypothetical protein